VPGTVETDANGGAGAGVEHINGVRTAFRLAFRADDPAPERQVRVRVGLATFEVELVVEVVLLTSMLAPSRRSAASL